MAKTGILDDPMLWNLHACDVERKYTNAEWCYIKRDIHLAAFKKSQIGLWGSFNAINPIFNNNHCLGPVFK